MLCYESLGNKTIMLLASDVHIQVLQSKVILKTGKLTD